MLVLSSPWYVSEFKGMGRPSPPLLWLSAGGGGPVCPGGRAERRGAVASAPLPAETGAGKGERWHVALSQFQPLPGALHCLWQRGKEFMLIRALIPGVVSSSEEKGGRG